MTRFSVSVPATTANLGPGYDSFGLALELRNEFHAELANEWSVEITGEGMGTLSQDEGNYVVVAMREVFEHAGYSELKAKIRCDNKVPLGSGLGSSSSALVGGGVLARRLIEEKDPTFTLLDNDLLQILSKLEGHPDNIAPAMMGGFTICFKDDDEIGNINCERFDLICPIAAIVVPSTTALATSYSRGLLPDTVSHEDAVFNLSHAGLLASALVSNRPDLLTLAMHDRLHHPYRLPVVEDYYPVKEILLNAGTNAVVLSGAGPTIVGFVGGIDAEDALIRAKAIVFDISSDIVALGTRLAPLPLPFARTGALITDNNLVFDLRAT
jgi:homoserine kinase